MRRTVTGPFDDRAAKGRIEQAGEMPPNVAEENPIPLFPGFTAIRTCTEGIGLVICNYHRLLLDLLAFQQIQNETKHTGPERAKCALLDRQAGKAHLPQFLSLRPVFDGGHASPAGHVLVKD